MVETQRGQLNQINLKDTPNTAINIYTPNKIHPLKPFKDIKQKGA